METHVNVTLATRYIQLERATGRRAVTGTIDRLDSKYIIALKRVNEIKVYTGRHGKRTQRTVYINLILDLILRICFVTGLRPA